MENKLASLWQRRIENQELPLIGTNTPGEGNGYHDRISFKIPYHLLDHSTRDKNQGHYVYSDYIQTLSNFLNPSLTYESNDIIKLNNCSETYRKTFLTYLRSDDYEWHDTVNKAFGRWADQLAREGRIIMEYVSWYDNETQDFYAYELKQLDSDFIKVKRRNIILKAHWQIDNEIQEIRRVVIPKSKCLIVEWPKELGGFEGFRKKMDLILKLGGAFPPLAESAQMTSGDMFVYKNNWDMKYNQLLGEWGVTQPIEDTTEYYKQYNYFRLWGTLLYCSHALLNGFQQLVSFLNESLNENAKISVERDDLSIDYYVEMKEKWLNGSLSFKEAAKYLNFNR